MDFALLLLALSVWLPTVGYLLGLELLGRRRGEPPPRDPAVWPKVAVLLPVLDEERWIGDRLRDFAQTEYPPDLLELWVVDGGSRDGTLAPVEGAVAADPRVRLLRVEDTRAKLEQVRLALEKVDARVVVVADADVALAPDCIRELVRALEADPAAALVGAHVVPDSPLLEERLHWWLLDRLSWLEGKVLGAASVAAPCYALRPEAVRTALPPDVTADDVHLSLVARSQGWRVRRSRSARARELRVPGTLGELSEYRRRRGFGFVHAVRAFVGVRGAGARFHTLLVLRYWQLRCTPWLALTLLASLPFAGGFGLAGLACLGVLSIAPLVLSVRRAPEFASDRRPASRLPVAMLRLAAVNGFALLTTRRGRAAPRHHP